MSTKSSPRWLRFAGTCPRRIQYRNLSGVTCIRRAAVFTETRLSARCSLSGPSTNFDSRRRISVSAIKNGTASSCAAISPARDSTHRHHAAALVPSEHPGSRSLRRCRHHSRSRISTKSVVSVTPSLPGVLGPKVGRIFRACSTFDRIVFISSAALNSRRTSCAVDSIAALISSFASTRLPSLLRPQHLTDPQHFTAARLPPQTLGSTPSHPGVVDLRGHRKPESVRDGENGPSSAPTGGTKNTRASPPPKTPDVYSALATWPSEQLDPLGEGVLPRGRLISGRHQLFSCGG